MLTKTDYLRYLEAPMHLWAEAHGWLEDAAPSEYALHLMQQGRSVQQLAQEFLSRRIGEEYPEAEISFETVLTDGEYYARLDAAVHFPEADTYDIYEIKSSGSVRKEHLLDAAFQRIVAAADLNVRHTFIVHVDTQYRREGEVDLDAFFVIENVDLQIGEVCEELKVSREMALRVANADTPDGIETCLKPNDCPCPRLCHPNLPEHPIYDLPRIGQKARELKAAGILAIEDIPVDFKLSGLQATHAAVVRHGAPRIDHAGVKAALDEMDYPLYFLDYETYNPAVPWYDGYAPYQHMVFQYSLHVYQGPDAVPVHYEFLAAEKEDPALRLAADLLENIGPTGSVVVWNKSFEMARNREMAALHPQFASGLDSINARIIDLMEVFSKGSYVHPDFRGSASIKNVLPVIAPELSYVDLPIPNGTSAMLAWVAMVTGEMEAPDFEQTRQALLEYCKLDTWAMVRIWQELRKL